VVWIAFPLHPDTPPGGRLLTDLFGRGQPDIAQMIATLKAEARRLGLAFGDRTMTYNSRSAQVMCKWAESTGNGSRFHRAVYEAYFARSQNIADPAVLAKIAARAGLDPDAALAAVNDPRYGSQVDADWQRALAQGVRAVPTLAIGRRMLTGAYPTDTIREFVQGAGR